MAITYTILSPSRFATIRRDPAISVSAFNAGTLFGFDSGSDLWVLADAALDIPARYICLDQRDLGYGVSVAEQCFIKGGSFVRDAPVYLGQLGGLSSSPGILVQRVGVGLSENVAFISIGAVELPSMTGAALTLALATTRLDAIYSELVRLRSSAQVFMDQDDREGQDVIP